MKGLRIKTNGITLIALVITIIIILVLAGITIAMITGDNGVLLKTIDAIDETEKSKMEEEAKLERYEEIVDEYDDSVEKVTVKYDSNGGTAGSVPITKKLRKRKNNRS